MWDFEDWIYPYEQDMHVTEEFWYLMEYMQLYIDEVQQDNSPEVPVTPEEFNSSNWKCSDKGGSEDQTPSFDRDSAYGTPEDMPDDNAADWDELKSNIDPGNESDEEAFPSNAYLDWQQVKRGIGFHSWHMHRLMNQHGLENLKQHALKLWRLKYQATQHNRRLESIRFSTMIVGNPGTGKTMAATMLRKYIRDLEV